MTFLLNTLWQWSLLESLKNSVLSKRYPRRCQRVPPRSGVTYLVHRHLPLRRSGLCTCPRGSKVDEGDAVRWLSIDEQPPVTRVLSAVALASMSTERYKSGHKLISWIIDLFLSVWIFSFAVSPETENDLRAKSTVDRTTYYRSKISNEAFSVSRICRCKPKPSATIWGTNVSSKQL